MSWVTCTTCGRIYDASVRFCPQCMFTTWLTAPNIVPPKHSLKYSASACTAYRSMVNPDIESNLPPHLRTLAESGTLRYRPPSGYSISWTNPTGGYGSGMRSGQTTPTDAKDTLMLVRPFDSSVHAFAEDATKIARQDSAGIYQPPPRCSFSGCDNLALPNHHRCVLHTVPPRAK